MMILIFSQAINNSLKLYLSKFIEVGVTYKIGPVSVRDVLHRVQLDINTQLAFETQTLSCQVEERLRN